MANPSHPAPSSLGSFLALKLSKHLLLTQKASTSKPNLSHVQLLVTVIKIIYNLYYKMEYEN